LSIQTSCEKVISSHCSAEARGKCSMGIKKLGFGKSWGREIFPAADCHSADSLPWQFATLLNGLVPCRRFSQAKRYRRRVMRFKTSLCVSHRKMDESSHRARVTHLLRTAHETLCVRCYYSCAMPKKSCIRRHASAPPPRSTRREPQRPLSYSQDLRASYAQREKHALAIICLGRHPL